MVESGWEPFVIQIRDEFDAVNIWLVVLEIPEMHFMRIHHVNLLYFIPCM